jgi:hypothetical protein
METVLSLKTGVAASLGELAVTLLKGTRTEQPGNPRFQTLTRSNNVRCSIVNTCEERGTEFCLYGALLSSLPA